MWRHQWLETKRGFKESLWVFLSCGGSTGSGGGGSSHRADDEDPGVPVGVPVVGATALGVILEHQWLETQRGFQESQWVFLWWEHWQWWWGFQ
jgi:hypothetical protein